MPAGARRCSRRAEARIWVVEARATHLLARGAFPGPLPARRPMPVRYDSLLVSALASELHGGLVGRRVEELHLDPVARTLRLVLEDAEELVWILHPAAGHVVARPARGDRRSRRRRGRGVLPGARLVSGVEAPGDERRLRFGLDPLPGAESSRAASLVVELHTNQWNALLEEDGMIRSVLWRRLAGDRPLREGALYRPPPARPRLGVDAAPDPERWRAWWRDLDPHQRRGALIREIAWASPVNVGWILGGPGTEAPEAVRERVSQLAAAAGEARVGGRGLPGRAAWILARRWGPQPYPLPLGEAGAEPAASLLAAMAEAARREGVEPGVPEDASGAPVHGSGESSEADRIEAALLGLLDRIRRRREALERQLGSGPDPEELRAAGHLLLARLREIPPGADSVLLRDFDGSERTLRLDPRADAAANAEGYYERARRRERAQRWLPGRILAARDRERRLRRLLARLRTDGPTDAMRALAARHAAATRPGGRPPGAAPRRPWRRLRSSGGLEIRVGRSARDNDDLTFHHSSPEDIWLHARHAHGAHVILRWGRRDQNPPARDLEDAAVAAAVFSEARGSGAVPVDWTRRKYVRKPRKAPPGAVVPDRVRTLFVAPDGGRVRRMNDDGPDAS